MYTLVKSMLFLAIVRVGLWLLPFQTLRRFLAHFAQIRMKSQGETPESLEQVVWAVVVASQHVPRATCLTQALVAQVLLCRRGHSASLRIGVARSEEGEFQAHAWVECQGRVVIGGITALSRFTRLLSLEEHGT